MGSHAQAHTGAVAFDPRVLRPLRRPEIQAEDSVHPDRVFWSAARKPYPAYLWGDGQSDKGRYSIVAHSPTAVLTAQGNRTQLSCGGSSWTLDGPPLEIVEALVSGVEGKESDLPFLGGAIGYISYEQACHGMGCPASSGPLPAQSFALYSSAYLFDHSQEKGYWVGPKGEASIPPEGRARVELSAWIPSVTRERYLGDVERILEHISAGDLYQANYTHRLEAEGRADAPALALELRRRLPSPMGAYLGFPTGHIWSLSPERLLSGERGKYLESRPIKGTRRRDPCPEFDSELSLELYRHPKDRAELLMIVDLVRNDLGRVASTGSVRVHELYGRQSYSNVHHLEAVIRSDFPEERTWAEALQAILPGGSVTGTPKRSAVGLLSRLEAVPRSVYTGALGYLSCHGKADFNLPIRTLYHDGRRFYLHSGGGVVADSRPEAEYEESLVKVGHILELLRSL